MTRRTPAKTLRAISGRGCIESSRVTETRPLLVASGRVREAGTAEPPTLRRRHDNSND